MIFKPIYLNRLKTLKRDIKEMDIYLKANKDIITQYNSIVLKLTDDLKIISDNEKIEPNIKYIQLNERITEIEKILNKIEVIYQDMNKKVHVMNKNKSILLQNCIEDHSNISEKDIINEFSNFLFDEKK